MSGLLAIQGLTRHFGGLTAVDDLSFSLEAGEIVGLLGPNGSGKTTVINLISGSLKPDRGAISFNGARIDGLRPNRIARAGIARTFQLVRIFASLTVIENVEAALAFGRNPKSGTEAAWDAMAMLAEVGLEASVDKPAGDLTYIDQKRLELARAMAGAPDLLLLDEWLAGLNPSELREGIDLIRRIQGRGIAILMVEHVIEAIRDLCSRTIVMASGRKIADGPTDDVLRQPAVVEAYLGSDDA